MICMVCMICSPGALTSPERTSQSAARPSWKTPASRSPPGDQAQHMPASRPARRVPCATHPAGVARKKYLQSSKRVLARALLLRCFLAAQSTLEFGYRYTLQRAEASCNGNCTTATRICEHLHAACRQASAARLTVQGIHLAPHEVLTAGSGRRRQRLGSRSTCTRARCRRSGGLTAGGGRPRLPAAWRLG